MGCEWTAAKLNAAGWPCALKTCSGAADVNCKACLGDALRTGPVSHADYDTEAAKAKTRCE